MSRDPEKRPKTALVTGGSRGFGRGIVEALTTRDVDVDVVAVARDAGRLASLARERGVRTVAVDLSDELAATRLLGDVRPDLLVLCAGATPLMRPLQHQCWRSFSEAWELVRGLGPPLTPAIMGQAVIELNEHGERWPAVTYRIGGGGLAPLG